MVGSGFGGSVTALRLSEKGYQVTVLEAGQRFTPETLPKTSWDLRAFLWMPRLGLTGMQRITWLKDVVILSGAGVGGGSLVYANTLYTPPPPFFQDPQWAHITDWQSELAPHYDQASRMLGVVTNPTTTPSDLVMQKVAAEMGVAHTYHPTPVGVFFGEPGKEVDDPYFGGAGPRRTGCIECGNCMIGCRYGAKNRLDTNYLYLAEGLGAVVEPLTTVTAITPQDDGTWVVESVPTGKKGPVTRREADQVVLAAGTLGTQQLLHDMKATGVLPAISDRLGMLTRTNSEALLGRAVREGAGRQLRPRRRDHVELPPGRGHPHRAGPLRQGLERDGTAVDDPGRRRWPDPALAAVPAAGAAAPLRLRAQHERPPLVGEDDHRAGHADARQLDHRQADQARQAHQRPGSRRAEPVLDPRRARRGEAGRRPRSAATPAAPSATSPTCR